MKHLILISLFIFSSCEGNAQVKEDYKKTIEAWDSLAKHVKEYNKQLRVLLKMTDSLNRQLDETIEIRKHPIYIIK